MMNSWLSDQTDPERLMKEIRQCPELVFIHRGNRNQMASLRSVMDDFQSIRLFLAHRRSLLIVRWEGRKLIVTPTAHNKYLRNVTK